MSVCYLKGFAIFFITLIIASCAKSPEDIKPMYISPLAYDRYECSQLSQEAQRISARAANASGVQEEKASGDTVKMTVGLIIFWPTLLFMDGGGANESEVARLKGEMEAIEQASIIKNCDISFRKKRLSHS